LREEINDFRKSGEELTYETLNGLRFLDAVCRATLRVYPTILSMNRVAERNTVLPLAKPVKDVGGSLITELPIAKKTTLIM